MSFLFNNDECREHRYDVPKVIVYDIETAFDLAVDDKSRYMDRLTPYSNDKQSKLYPQERAKLMSNMYCFNYKFLEVVSDCVRQGEANGGYKTNYKHIRQEVIEAEPIAKLYEHEEADEVKIQCLVNLIKEAKEKGVTVILVSSPYWKGYPELDLHLIKDLAVKVGVPS